MRIITSDIINREGRGIGSFLLHPGQAALVVRNSEDYQNSLTRLAKDIYTQFNEFGNFEINKNSEKINITHPTISRLQGVFYAPENQSEGLLYLNVGQFLPKYHAGDRILKSPEEVFNSRLKESKVLRLSGDMDYLTFDLDSNRKFSILACKD